MHATKLDAAHAYSNLPKVLHGVFSKCCTCITFFYQKVLYMLAILFKNAELIAAASL
jgi:hypothetical protein